MQAAPDLAAPRLLIEYYTDPWCERSRAFEPHWQRLRAEFSHRFGWCYRLGEGGPAGQLACLAVKCAERQSPQAGHLYLGALREAALGQGRDLTRPEVLAAIADELAAQVPGLAKQLPPVLDTAAFRRDLAAQASAAAHGEDVRPARLHHLPRVPALVLRRAGQPAHAVAVRSQPYEALLHELAQAAPDCFFVASLVEGGAG